MVLAYWSNLSWQAVVVVFTIVVVLAVAVVMIIIVVVAVVVIIIIVINTQILNTRSFGEAVKNAINYYRRMRNFRTVWHVPSSAVFWILLEIPSFKF
jgi:hypothetical protein